MNNENVLKRITMNLADKADLENALALVNNLNAIVDYVAMMADVEIPTEEDNNESEI